MSIYGILFVIGATTPLWAVMFALGALLRWTVFSVESDFGPDWTDPAPQVIKILIGITLVGLCCLGVGASGF